MGRIILWTVFVTALTSCGPGYDPPTGGEEFRAKGILLYQDSPDTPPDRAVRIRELTEEETSALREFIRQSEYAHFDVLHKDHLDVPIVEIDSVRWWAYRSSLYRVEGGDAHFRKRIEGVEFPRGDRRGEIDMSGVLEWYRGLSE